MADASRRARGAAEGSDRGAGSRRRAGQIRGTDRLYHLLGIAAGKRRANPRLRRPPSGFCRGAAIADRDRIVGQSGGFRRGHAAIRGGAVDDAAPYRDGWIFRLDPEKESAVILRGCLEMRPNKKGFEIVIASASEAIHSHKGRLDCFVAEPVIGRAFAATVATS